MLRKFTIGAVMLCVTAGLCGCAEDYPRLPDLTRMDNLLTPQDREKAIKDLTGNQPAQATAAKMPEGQH